MADEAIDGAIITPTDNGPYHVRGTFEVVMPSGEVLRKRSEAWLCRCGGSKRKPFCDSTHSEIGFKAAEAAVEKADAQNQQSA